jgi:hypothetical protein
MVRRATKFVAAYNHLFKETPSNITLSDRIRIQKIAYLLQEKGVELNFNFCWYIHGVISFGLWDETRKHMPDLKESSGNLPESIKKIEDKFADRIKQMDSSELELITSMIYWKKKSNLEFKNEKLIDIIHAHKPRFSKENIKNGIQTIKELNL